MTLLGTLLEADAKKKPGKPSGTTITVSLGGQNGAANQKGNGSTSGAKKPSSGSKQQSPEAIRAKTLRDSLKHFDELSVFHRQKAAEHGTHEKFHAKDRPTKHMAILHKHAREGSENLQKIYRKMSDEAYRLTKPEEIEKRKEAEKEKKKTAKDKAKKKKTLKEMWLA